MSHPCRIKRKRKKSTIKLYYFRRTTLGRLTVKLIDGTQLKLGEIEIAAETDLARIKILSTHKGFERVASPALQENVTVLGNSLGAGRVTTLSGTVVGLNENEIETTAKFVSGNSGSPIVNKYNAVIGVATLLETFPDRESIVKGSIFEDGRRVGMRLDQKIDWVPVDMSKYSSRNRLILQTINFIEELPSALTASVSDEVAQRLTIKSLNDPVIKQWLKSRLARSLQMNKDFRARVDAKVAKQGKVFLYRPEYAEMEKKFLNEAYNESKKYWMMLQNKIVGKKRSISTATPYPDTTFMRKKLEHKLDMLDAAQVMINLIQESHDQYIDKPWASGNSSKPTSLKPGH